MEPLPLRDIRLPPPIGWWPPAPGWWLLAVCVPLLIWLGFKLYKKMTRQTAVKSARKLLRQIQLDADTEALLKLAALSQLLRRVAISLAPRQQTASLTGAEWLSYLDRTLSTKTECTDFSTGVGRYLADGHFRSVAPNDLDLPALYQLCERWLNRQAKR